jgi:hypothetical protein
MCRSALIPAHHISPSSAALCRSKRHKLLGTRKRCRELKQGQLTTKLDCCSPGCCTSSCQCKLKDVHLLLGGDCLLLSAVPCVRSAGALTAVRSDRAFGTAAGASTSFPPGVRAFCPCALQHCWPPWSAAGGCAGPKSEAILRFRCPGELCNGFRSAWSRTPAYSPIVHCSSAPVTFCLMLKLLVY